MTLAIPHKKKTDDDMRRLKKLFNLVAIEIISFINHFEGKAFFATKSQTTGFTSEFSKSKN